MDSGASGNYVRDQDKHALLNIHHNKGPNVLLPDMSSIYSSERGYLPIPELSERSQTAEIFPDLKSASLLSVGKLCDDNCVVQFDKEKMHVYKNHNKIIEGTRNRKDGLWDVKISPSPQPFHEAKLNVIIKKDQSTSNIIQYYQACCFHPRKSTFLKAI